MGIKQSITKYIILLKWESLYLLITTIYLLFLSKLNRTLNSMFFDNPLELLQYGENKPLWFFTVAVVLFIIGGLIIAFRINLIRGQHLEFEEIIAVLVGIVICIILLILIFVFINNPILRAILTVGLGGGIVVYTVGK